MKNISNRSLIILLLIVVVAVASQSCKDKEAVKSQPESDPTFYELISAHDWEYYEKTRDGVVQTDQRPCDFDQIYRYGLDSTHKVIEAGEYCANSIKWNTRYLISEAGDSLFQGANKQDAYLHNTHSKILTLTDEDLKLELTLSGIVWTWSFRK